MAIDVHLEERYERERFDNSRDHADRWYPGGAWRWHWLADFRPAQEGPAKWGRMGAARYWCSQFDSTCDRRSVKTAYCRPADGVSGLDRATHREQVRPAAPTWPFRVA